MFSGRVCLVNGRSKDLTPRSAFKYRQSLGSLSQAQGVGGNCFQRHRVSGKKKILSNASLNKELDTVPLIVFVEIEDGYC